MRKHELAPDEYMSSLSEIVINSGNAAFAQAQAAVAGHPAAVAAALAAVPPLPVPPMPPAAVPVDPFIAAGGYPGEARRRYVNHIIVPLMGAHGYQLAGQMSESTRFRHPARGIRAPRV